MNLMKNFLHPPNLVIKTTVHHSTSIRHRCQRPSPLAPWSRAAAEEQSLLWLCLPVAASTCPKGLPHINISKSRALAYSPHIRVHKGPYDVLRDQKLLIQFQARSAQSSLALPVSARLASQKGQQRCCRRPETTPWHCCWCKSRGHAARLRRRRAAPAAGRLVEKSNLPGLMSSNPFVFLHNIQLSHDPIPYYQRCRTCTSLTPAWCEEKRRELWH